MTKTMILTKKNFQESKLNKSCFCLQLFPFKMIFLLACSCFFPLCNQDSSKKIPHKYPSLVAAMTWELSKVTSTWVPRTPRRPALDERSGLNQWSWDSGGGFPKKILSTGARRWYASHPTAPRISEALSGKKRRSQNSQIMS